jgi:thymidylate kinase
MGMDGAGKSTVMEEIARWLASHNIKTCSLHIHDYSAKPISKVLDIFGKEQWIRRFRFLLFPWPFIALVDHMVIFRRRFANQDEDILILTDRYFYDKFIRFRFWGIVLPGVFYLYKWLVPKPLCAILLDVPVQIAMDRKGEYSQQDYEKFQTEYLRFATGMKGIVTVIDATAPLEEVVDSAKRVIISSLE